MEERVKIIARDIVSTDFGRLEHIKLRRRRFDSTEQELEREIYDIGESASIFLYDPQRACVLLIRQFRLPVFLATGRDLLIEVCAGRLQGLDAAARIVEEVKEETGLAIGTPRFLFDAFMSPGAYCERMSFFAAPYSAEDRISDGGGLAHEGEDIEVFETTLEEALAMIDRGEIIDAKTILLLNFAKRTGLMETPSLR
ncbi:MAG: NUDIX domain-containing protein [Beijerinckiaceae bacterium]